MIRDTASFTIKELKFHKVAPNTEIEWKIIEGYLLEATKS